MAASSMDIRDPVRCLVEDADSFEILLDHETMSQVIFRSIRASSRKFGPRSCTL